MPLPLRRVEPAHVARGTLPERFPVQNDLEAVANGTLANVIVQLSSLSHHAEELFGDLIKVGSEIATRANNLQARIDRLAVRVVQMDGSQEELGSMQDALNTKPFQSSMSFDQQVVSRQSMTAAMSKTFLTCDKPPPLDKLNSYRDDGKDGLKFYTDPNYFFELWRQEMLKDTEKVIKKHQSMDLHEPHKPKHDGGQRHKKRVRQPHNTRERFRHIVIEQGEHLMPGQEYNRPGIAVPEVIDGVLYPPDQNSVLQQRQSAARPSSIELDKSYSPGYNESPYGNGLDLANRGDYRLNQLQHHNSAILNRSLSQSQYEYDAYTSQIYNQSQHRYNSHVTPPPAYSDVSSPNAYSNNSRFSSGGIAAASTPNRSGSMSMNVTPNSSMTNGYGFRPSQPPPAPPPNFVGTPPSSHSGTPTRVTRMMNSRETLPPPPPPPTETDQSHMNGHQNGNPSMPPPPPMHDEDNDEPLPPPPPPPSDTGVHINHSVENLAPSPELVPPPPPPPPMNSNLNLNPTQKSNPVITNGGLLKPATKKFVPVVDDRSELLKSIRGGIALRKVETKKELGSKEEKAGGTYCDVASILARRVAVEMSDSDSGSDDDDENDSDEWDEASA